MTSDGRGRYRLRTESALEFEHTLYSWDVEFEVLAGSTTSLELSNDNAAVAVADGGLTDHGTVYEQNKDGDLVEPILRGRIKEVANVRQGTASLKDVGYWGYYEYSPEAFAPGAVVTLHIWEQDVPDPQRLDLPDVVLRRIQSDLKPYFDARDLEAGGEASED